MIILSVYHYYRWHLDRGREKPTGGVLSRKMRCHGCQAAGCMDKVCTRDFCKRISSGNGPTSNHNSSCGLQPQEPGETLQNTEELAIQPCKVAMAGEPLGFGPAQSSSCCGCCNELWLSIMLLSQFSSRGLQRNPEQKKVWVFTVESAILVYCVRKARK